MVCEWGMSKVMGPISYGKSQTHPFVGMQQQGQNEYSEKTAQAIDAEVNKFVLAGYETAKKIITEKKAELDKLAEALIIWETLDAVQVQDIVDGKDIGLPTIEIIAEENKDDKTKDDEDEIETAEVVDGDSKKDFSSSKKSDPSIA